MVKSFQKNCVTALLYPLIFETMKSNMLNLSSSTFSADGSVSINTMKLKFITV